MENTTLQEGKSLLITAYCFKLLHTKILKKFKDASNDVIANKTTQLYGFGNYNRQLPSLKKELEKISESYINGKYIYDKIREIEAGKPTLKLSGYYKVVLFKYLGYDNIIEFIKYEVKDNSEREKQQKLLNKDETIKENYYVYYHYGEIKEVIKGQVTVINNWKNVVYNFIYPQEDGSNKEFSYHGTIIRRSDTLHIKTKTLIGGKMVEGGDDVLYIGHSEPSSGAFLLGTYSAYDVFNKAIAGKLIWEKCDTKEEMIKKSFAKKTPAYIAQEIRNKRIVNRGIVPNSILELSPNSPFSSTYDKLPGEYKLSFLNNSKLIGDFGFNINPFTFKTTPIDDGVLIVEDNFSIISNGSVLYMSFKLVGATGFSQLELFFKTYYLNKNKEEIKGVFSGLDIENRLISGEVNVDFKPKY